MYTVAIKTPICCTSIPIGLSVENRNQGSSPKQGKDVL